MKNKNFKIIALLTIAFVGIYALNKVKKSKKTPEKIYKNDDSLESLLLLATVQKPFSFSKKTNDINVTVVYSYDGNKYTKQSMGPTVRSFPLEITKQEFTKAYNEYLL